jgi:hypothetical protein
MRAETLWKVFAFAVAGSMLFDAMSLVQGSAVGFAILLFRALALLGLFGFAWNRAFFNQRIWKVVVLIQFVFVLLFLVQVATGLLRFSDSALLVALLQASLVAGVISVFTLIGLFLYAWSPSLWAPVADQPTRGAS